MSASQFRWCDSDVHRLPFVDIGFSSQVFLGPILAYSLDAVNCRGGIRTSGFA